MAEAQDLRLKTADELKEQLIGLRKEAFNLRFQKASGQLENTAQVRRVRRDIARIKTILGEQRRPARVLTAKAASAKAAAARAKAAPAKPAGRKATKRKKAS